MDIEKLLAKDILDTTTEVEYHYLTRTENSCTLHCHDFFEIFIVVKGAVIHSVNGVSQRLEEGFMVLIRPNDSHFYQKDISYENHIVNLAFSKSLTEEIFSFLGKGFSSNKILDCPLPPKVVLSNYEKQSITDKIKALFLLPSLDKEFIKTHVRILIFELITTYFQNKEHRLAEEMPLWLQYTLKEMSKAENIKGGLTSLQRLTGKTPEHISRVFRKYLGITPTDYINELKTNYAANLLLHSDEDIITIAMIAGFDNLSHFYHLFKKHFKVSPGKYRSMILRNNI